MIELPKDRTLDANGLRLNYLEWGDRDSPSMLLLHGTASNAHFWDYFSCEVQNNYHIIALDLRGHGDSESPPNYQTGYPPNCWTADIDCVADALGITPMILIGYAAGGNMAIHYAAEHTSKVAKLVLVETNPAPSGVVIPPFLTGVTRRT